MPTLKELFDQFVKERIYLKNVTPKTVYFHNQAWASFSKHLPDITTTQQLSKAVITDYLMKLRESGIKTVSINTYCRSLTLRSAIPPLYSQEGVEDPVVWCKFFTPDSNWTWFVTEGQEAEGDFLFFGFVKGFEGEWGYFALSELESARGPWNLPLERDIHFKPDKWSEVKKRERIEY